MKRSKLMLSALLVVGATVTGCTRPNELGLAPLDQPAIVKTEGAQKTSQVTMYRLGTWDPEGTLITMRVTDASVFFTTTADKASVQELTFKLADENLPASST